MIIFFNSTGYVVRATIRSTKDKGKVGFLEDLANVYPRQLTLFEADLTKEGSFDEAIESIVY
jgi:hypothetical protein